MPLILRAEKGSALTYEEMDGNFEYSIISENITYSNSISGLSANNVQVAIDTLASSASSASISIVEASPPGSVIFTVRSTAPTGWVKANGAAVSRTLYANLWNALGNPNTGDGSTTFDLPDLRGEFIRAWDDGRGLDSGRTIHSVQDDAIRNITGTVGPLDDGSKVGLSGAFFDNGAISYDADSSGSGGGWRLGFDVSRVVPTAAENRPRNYALLACIKY